MRIGVIGGTGAAFPIGDLAEIHMDTPYGPFEAAVGHVDEEGGREVVFVQRHGADHARLSSAVEHRANLWGLKESGVAGIVATTVCGVIDPAVGLGRAIVFDDMLFPDNRLPDGRACTFFDTPGQAGCGHFIFDSPFSPSLRKAAIAAAVGSGLDVVDGGCYAYALGPRFNTKAEIRTFATAGAIAVSQTAGPEATLAGELELPYCLLGFGVDYANGVMPVPTPVDILDENIALSESAFQTMVAGIVRGWKPCEFDTGFIYRFE